MRIGVTGASGFVGAALLNRLGGTDHETVAFSRRRPAHTNASTQWVVVDLTREPHSLRDVAPIDVLVHLAGRAHVLHETDSDALDSYHSVNVEATARLARDAVNAGVRRFVFVSSIGVHGSGGPEPVTEASAIKPKELYARSKAEAESHLLRICGESLVELVIVRPALVVGPGAPGNLERLARLVFRGVPVPVPRSDNARSFITLGNLVELLMICVDRPAAEGQAFVAANSEWPSTRQVINWIAEGMNRRTATVRVPTVLLKALASVSGRARLYDKLFNDLRVDAAKARTVLGWRSHELLADAFRDLGRAFRARAIG